eukprot:2621194-Amphidinium_carterae.1
MRSEIFISPHAPQERERVRGTRFRHRSPPPQIWVSWQHTCRAFYPPTKPLRVSDEMQVFGSCGSSAACDGEDAEADF